MEEETKVVKKVSGPAKPQKLRSIDVELAQKLNTGSTQTKSSALFKLRSVVKNEKLTEIQLLKIWKGLFLSLYNTDKPIVQEEFSKDISKLTTYFKDYKDSLMFIKCFFIILQKHWDYIDKYRVDKFYSLVRKMLNSSFQILKKKNAQHEEGSEEEQARLLLNEQIYSGLVKIFKSTVLNTSSDSTTNTNGILLHFADIYLEELFKVTQGHMEPINLTKILLPFVNFLTKSEDDVSCKRIKERVFDRLLTTYSPFDKKDAYYLPKVGVSSSTPDIFPTDYEMMSKLFFKCASSKDTLEQNRKTLYGLKNQFKRAQAALEELEELADNIVLDENGDIVENPNVNPEDLEGDEDSDEEFDVDQMDSEDSGEGEFDDEIDADDAEELDDDEELEDEDEDEDEEEEEEDEVPPPPKNLKSKPSPAQKNKQQQQQQQSPAKPTQVTKKQPPAPITKKQQSPAKPTQVTKKQPPAKPTPITKKQQSPVKPTSPKVVKKSTRK
ncbi:hypothetical protein ACTFIZ_007424 [Dictyostelium cf. discoideum]